MMLEHVLEVTLADFMPAKGVVLTVQDESGPYRISERLHLAIKDEATKQGVTIAVLFRALRDELSTPKARPFDSIESYRDVILRSMTQLSCPHDVAANLITKCDQEVRALFAAGSPAIVLIDWLSLEWRARS